MPLLSDPEAERLRAALSPCVANEVLVRWIRYLLADRRERIALALRTSRQLHVALRIGLGPKGSSPELAEAITDAKRTIDAPWSGQECCRICGAPVVLIRTDGAGNAHTLVHPDRRACRGSGLVKLDHYLCRGEAKSDLS